MNRPLCKRLLSLILTVAMLISLNATPAAVWAAELEQPVTITASATRVNPAYAHLEAPVSNGAAVASTGETYAAANVEEAAALLKEVLLQRTDAAVIQIPVDFVFDEENTSAFWAEVWAMEDEIFDEAVAHTGNPQEGDYLFYSYYERDMQAGVSLGDTTTVSISYTFTYHTDAQQEQAVTEVIDAFIEEYGLAGITDPAADIEKFLISYDWLCGKTTYSDTVEEAPSTIYSSYGAAVEGSCVCQGYAVTLYRLLLELGVDCRVISGTDGDGGDHAWNIVELDGVYYNTDATWDDSWQEAGQAWEWCLRCDANFPDHIRDEEFATESFYAAYPMATEDQPDINGGGSSAESPVLEIGTPAQVTASAESPYGDYAVTPTVTEGYRAIVTGCTDSYCSFIDSEGNWLGEYTVLEAGETYTLWFEAYVETDTEITVSVDLAHDFYKGVCKYCDETATIVASGTCGDDLSWTLDSGNGLTITGTGAIYDYTYTDHAPWYDVRGDIRYIFLDEAVTRIGDYAFYQTESLQECLLHEGLASIGTAAFLQSGLPEVSFPSTLTTLEADAFWNCNGLTEVVIPANLVNLDLSAFYYCDSMTAYTVAEDNPNYSSADGVLFNKDKTELMKFPLASTATQYAVPDTVVTIREFAFDSCQLQQVEIPAAVTAIGEYAFSDCGKLQAFVVAEENANYSAGSNGELMNKDQTLLIRFPGAYSGSYTVPATVTTIENSAFRITDGLTSVVIPENVIEIKDLAFQYCWKLEKVEVYNPNCVFGSAVLNASESAVLYGYTGSTAETYAANEGYTFVSLGEYAGGSEEAPTSGECGDSLSWSYLDGVLTISGTGAMYDYQENGAPWQQYMTEMTQLVIADGVTYIGSYAFYNYTMWGGAIDVPASVTGLGAYAFQAQEGSAPTEVHFSGNAPAAVENCFGTNPGRVYYPNSNTTWTQEFKDLCGGSIVWCPYDTENLYIDMGGAGEDLIWILDKEYNLILSGTGSMLFPYSADAPWTDAYNTQIVSITLPEGLTSINSLSFWGAANVSSITIPSTVTRIGTAAFSGCTGLKTITFTGIAPSIGEDAFASVTATVNYPAGDDTWTEDIMQQYGGTLTWEASQDAAYPELTAGTEVTVDVAEGGTAIYKFVAPVTENYYFCSVAGGDTYGIIYNSNMEELVSNDDDGSQNFGITIPVEAGTTIYLGARLLGGEAGTITVLMKVVHSYTSETVTEATCTVEGLIRHTCEYCGDSYEETYLAAHTYGEDNLCTVCGDEKGEKGACGDSLSWSYLDGLLTVSGTGAMYDYQENGAPWQAYAAEITQIVIEDGITYIGDYAFYNYSMWDTINVPASVTSLGNYAFQAKEGEVPTQVKFTGNAPVLAENSFGTNVGYVRYPYSNSTWDQEVKDACGSIIMDPYDDQGLYIDMGGAGHDLIWILDSEYTLKLVGSGKMEAYYMADMPWVTYWDSIQRIELPEGLTNIRYLSFCGLTKVTSITIPSTVVEVGTHAIDSCEALESIYFTGDAPVIDEFAFNQITATVYYPAGNETWTEDVMQQYGGTLTWVAYEATTEELFELDGANLALEDGLNMNFFVEPQKVAEDYYAVITKSYADGRADHVVTVPYAEWNSLMGEVFYVTYTGIAAKEMGDTISVVIYNAEGEAVSKPWTDSVQAYAVRLLNDDPVEAMETLLVDMLNYGAAAQVQFGYNTANLVNDVLTDAQKACATASYETESNLVSGTGRAGTTLTLKNRIALDFIFKNTAIGTDYTGLYAVATYTDHYGNEVETRIDTVKVYNESYGYVSVPGLAVADYGQAVTCTVYDAEGNVLAWSTDSIEGYAHRMKGSLPEMVDAIMKFCTSSYNYFH